MPFYFLLSALLIVADQIVKVLVRTHIPLGASVPFLPGVMDLTYIQNTGAAFSLLADKTWLLSMLSAVSALLIVVVMCKKLLPHWTGMLALSLLLGGAVGNLIDRVSMGFVTDMFRTTFVNFAVFNVADMGVTVGGVLLCISILFAFGQKREEEETP